MIKLADCSWEYDPAKLIFRCRWGCGVEVTLRALFEFLGGETPGTILSVSLNYLAAQKEE